jgi:integrase
MKKAEIAKLLPEPRPGWHPPDRHSLRRTCASAVAQVASMAVVAAILGHSAQSVTDLYVSIPLEDQITALNRASRIIGPEQANVVPLAARMERRMEDQSRASGAV